MIPRPSLILSLGLALLTILPPLRAAEVPHNTLTEAERAAGWRLLFDGRTTTGWRSYKKPSFPDKGWEVEDGCLHHQLKAGGGEVISTEKFEDYEFAFEWRINAGGNSGVKYFITEERSGAVGHEYQLMGEPDLAAVRRDLLRATGSFYEVMATPADLPWRPPGAWNQSRIIVRGQHVEHWLNGRRMVAYELGSEAVKAGIAASKFKNVAGFGTKFPHHLLLQDHGGDVWFRNLKLLPLKP